MTEHHVMAALLKTYRKMRPQAVVFKHADRWTFGIPDMSVTDIGITSWWEVKHANPDFESQGIQQLTAMRLAQTGICFYIIYAEKPKEILVIRPKDIGNWRAAAIARTSGFNHEWMAGFIQAIHQSRTRLEPDHGLSPLR